MGKVNQVAIIASKGDMETALKVLSLCLGAASMDAEVHVFCTFGGLSLLQRQLSYDFPEMLKPFEENLAKLPELEDLRQMAIESGVRFIGCQMTMDLLSIGPDQLIDDIEFAGAATFMEKAMSASTTITF